MFMKGDSFPGDANRPRLKRYRDHRRLLKGMYDAAMDVQTAIDALGTSDYLHAVKGEILRQLAGDIRIVANLPKTICRRLTGMVNQGLVITADSKSGADAIDAALKASAWGQRKRQAVYRSIAYGNGVLTQRRLGESGLVMIDQRDPWTWFPQVDRYNPGSAAAHTFAWIIESGDREYLLQEYHEAGRITRVANQIKSKFHGERDSETLRDVTVGDAVSWAAIMGDDAPAEVEQTGVDEPLVAVIQSWTDDDSIFGDSILSGNETLIYEASGRLSQIATILDQHAAPKLQGPESATQRDPNTGVATFDVRGSRWLPREDKQDPEFAYLTWESQLEHAHQELERVLSLLCVQMDMSPDLLGLSIGNNKAAEATQTLRIRSFSTIQAVEDYRAFQRVGLEAMARQILALSGAGDATASIKYGDPLPLSSEERADVIQKHRMSGLISLETAVSRINPDWTADEVGAEIERIRAEELSMLNPGQA